MKKTNPNLVLSDILRLEMKYYKHCEKIGLNVREQALNLFHFFDFMRMNTEQLTEIINKRTNGKTKPKTMRKRHKQTL